MKILLIFSFLLALPICAKPEPLLGSIWAKKHPNQLPYTSCEIFACDINIGLIRTFTKNIAKHSRALKCQTRRLKDAPHGLEFKIPLGDIDIKAIGLTAYLGSNGSAIFVSNLDGRSVSELYGKHKGYAFSIGVSIASGTYKSYGKKEDIHLLTGGNPLAAGIEIGKSVLSIKPRKAINRKMCLNNRYIINADTGRERNEEYCNDMLVDPKNNKKLLFDSSQISDLKFVYKSAN